MKLIPALITSVFVFSFFAPEAAHAVPKVRIRCSQCNANVSGDWNYSLILNGTPKVGFPKTVTLVRQGRSVTGVNASDTFTGSIYGRWLNLTMVVTGEETEGFSRIIQASYDGERIVGQYTASNGELGTFVATPAP